MAYWLLKTEPGTYSAADLAKEKTAKWDGVANPTAVKHLRSMKKGDLCLIYHTGDERQCVALAEVVGPPRDDPTNPKLAVVDLKFKSHLKHPVTLDTIKADKAFAGWDLLRIGRLSVVPTPDKLWNRLIELSSKAPAK
jgi:predicted RNA-binding protein with PUA-like domain